MNTTGGNRFKVSLHQILAAQNQVSAVLKRRLDEKGNEGFISTHEALGVLTEEYMELIDAVRADNLSEFAKEMVDVAVTAVFAIASSNAYLENNEGKRKHSAVHRVECSCGEIYANPKYLQKHLKESS